ncbi:hypothetical protein JQC72_00920, partial [Polycladomyces sp. WAk]|nr:hypothetical protein [Polycladomyces sp. WAk]
MDGQAEILRTGSHLDGQHRFGNQAGFIQVIADKESKQLLGVQIVGPEASSLIAEAVLAIEMGASAENLSLTIHAHPTLPEALMEAAEGVLGHAIHMVNK